MKKENNTVLSINKKSVEVFYFEQIWFEGEVVVNADSRNSRDHHTSLPSSQVGGRLSKELPAGNDIVTA